MKKQRYNNLKPFKKGVSGNPNGRPRKIPALEAILEENMTDEKNGFAYVDLIIKKLRDKAIGGDFKSIEYLLNRCYGKPKESIKHEVESKEEIEKSLIQIINERRLNRDLKQS